MNKIEFGDCRGIMSDWNLLGVKVQMCVTSPPYFGLRDYGVSGQLGLENTPDEYVKNMVETFRLVRDLLADDGTLWLNLGDSYGAAKIKRITGLKPKNLLGIPGRVALALQADGWILRQDIIWHKPNPMPESVTDRCTKAHEYIFLLTKKPKYYFDYVAIKEPAAQADRVRKDKMGGNKGDKTHHSPGSTFTGSQTRNRRDVWTVAPKPYKGAHCAAFPPDLIRPCILAGSHLGDIVFDPFMGSGTTAQVALKHGRRYLGCELNPEYEKLQLERIAKVTSL